MLRDASIEACGGCTGWARRGEGSDGGRALDAQVSKGEPARQGGAEGGDGTDGNRRVKKGLRATSELCRREMGLACTLEKGSAWGRVDWSRGMGHCGGEGLEVVGVESGRCSL